MKVEGYQKGNVILIKVGNTTLSLDKTEDRPWINIVKGVKDVKEENWLNAGYQHLVISSFKPKV